MVTDACGTGAWAFPTWSEGIPSVTYHAAAGAPSGIITGDQVTMHWDEECGCGWKGPRIGKTITRFAEMEGGDDKITCAGSAQAYNEFMEYVMQV